MTRVVHFEISADHPEKAAEFYKTVFGWKFEQWKGPMEYWMIDTGKGPGINGGLVRRGTEMEVTAHTISVGSVDAYTKKIKKAGGEILTPKMPLPGVGWFARFKDPEGNIVAIMQDDKKAK